MKRSAKMAAYLAIGVVLGSAFILMAGILAIQANGVQSGAVIGLNNEVLKVTSPRTPFFQWLSMALLGALTFHAALRLPRDRRSATSLAVGLTVAVLASLVIAQTVEGTAVAGMATSAPPLGWQGWLQKGAETEAVHVVALLTLTVSLFPIVGWRRETPKSSQDDSTPTPSL